MSTDKPTIWWNLARWALGSLALAGVAVMLVQLVTGELWERIDILAIATVVCAGLAFAANDRYRRARFAEVHTSWGVVTAVHERPADGDSPNFVRFWVEADRPDGIRIARHVDVQGWPDPESWVGRRILLRHRTLDKDRLSDAFVGDEEREATLGGDPR